MGGGLNFAYAIPHCGKITPDSLIVTCATLHFVEDWRKIKLNEPTKVDFPAADEASKLKLYSEIYENIYNDTHGVKQKISDRRQTKMPFSFAKTPLSKINHVKY